MSTGASGSADASTDLRATVVSTLREEFPQLRGVEGAVQGVDPESGMVTMSFGCGCSGGLSDAAEAAIENRLVNRVEGVSGMQTESGCGCGSGRGGSRGHSHGHSHGGDTMGEDDSGPEAPF